MRKTARMKMLILALMLAVSHVALISHVTAHFAPNLDQCELCVSQAQLSSAIPAAEQGIPVEPESGFLPPDASPCAIQARYPLAFRQRAPPPSSA